MKKHGLACFSKEILKGENHLENLHSHAFKKQDEKATASKIKSKEQM